MRTLLNNYVRVIKRLDKKNQILDEILDKITVFGQTKSCFLDNIFLGSLSISNIPIQQIIMQVISNMDK